MAPRCQHDPVPEILGGAELGSAQLGGLGSSGDFRDWFMLASHGHFSVDLFIICQTTSAYQVAQMMLQKLDSQKVFFDNNLQHFHFCWGLQTKIGKTIPTYSSHMFFVFNAKH